MRRVICVLALGGALVGAAPSPAASGSDLWATVNSCDSAGSRMGVRASMPGNGTAQRMYMHFVAQYQRGDGTWADTSSSSRWIRVGTARRRSVQSGFDFGFAEPPPGSSYVIRGRVEFRWTARKGGHRRIVRTARRITRAGIRGVEGGSPPGRSYAVCVIQR